MMPFARHEQQEGQRSEVRADRLDLKSLSATIKTIVRRLQGAIRDEVVRQLHKHLMSGESFQLDSLYDAFVLSS